MPTLQDIIQTFRSVEPQLRLELLLDYSKRLPPLPPELAAQRDAGLNRVHECMTPVYLWVQVNGAVHIQADVAEEAPTVRGFVGLLVEALNGAPPEAAAQVPNDLVDQLGLGDMLRMNRAVGLAAVIGRIKRTVAEAAGPANRDQGTKEPRDPGKASSPTRGARPETRDDAPPTRDDIPPAPIAKSPDRQIAKSAPSPDTDALRAKIIEAIKTVYDPEIPVNIYEMGLIYGIDIRAGNDVHVTMTLTSPSCPSAQDIPIEVEVRVGKIPEVRSVEVEITWEPTWTPAFMTEAAKLQLGMT